LSTFVISFHESRVWRWMSKGTITRLKSDAATIAEGQTAFQRPRR
jgi:hypothetical protein